MQCCAIHSCVLCLMHCEIICYRGAVRHMLIVLCSAAALAYILQDIPHRVAAKASDEE